jgi:hypothetical protein
VLAPGPSHSVKDRSLSVRLSSAAPEGFLTFSHAGDDWRACRDHVRERLAFPQETRRRRDLAPRRTAAPAKPVGDDNRIAAALALWREGVDPRGTLAEVYLRTRSLDLGDDLAGSVLRWHPRIGAMIALFRNISTDRPQAISRTFLDRGGRKIERKFLGPVGGCAVMLDAFDAVTTGLHVGEGIETCLAARKFGLRPAWAVGSAGTVASFPVPNGVEHLTLLAEHDGVSARAVQACAIRWDSAGREVILNRPIGGKDLNDVLRGAA